VPELPEVETTRRRLRPLVLGQTLRQVVHRDPARYRNTALAEGRRILEVDRRGKFLLFALEGGVELVAHLGMTGGFRLEPTPHTRAALVLEGRTLYFHDPRRFGRLFGVRRGDYREIPLLLRLGPEPLSEAFAFPGFFRGLKESARPLKALLLDQRLAAGVGNIYADEALFRARLSPFRPARSLTEEEARRLYRALREVLAEAVELGGSTLSDQSYRQPDGLPGGFQTRHAVYGREGLPCPACGRPVERRVGAGRGTHFCPTCQGEGP